MLCMARVLVVDDDPDILRVVEKVLRMQDHDVYTAHDAMKAMDILNSTTFDLLITDANMPQFSGYELARTIRNNKRFLKMAICMLTGRREKKDIEKAIRAGIDDYIVKPIDPTVLLQKIDAIFIKKPPADKIQYEFAENLHFAQAQLTIPARISQLTEMGLTLRSPVDVPEGIAIQLASLLFKRLEMQHPPAMKIISSRKQVEFDYEIRIAFANVSDSFHKKIRSWISAQKPQKKGAA